MGDSGLRHTHSRCDLIHINRKHQFLSTFLPKVLPPGSVQHPRERDSLEHDHVLAELSNVTVRLLVGVGVERDAEVVDRAELLVPLDRSVRVAVCLGDDLSARDPDLVQGLVSEDELRHVLAFDAIDELPEGRV